MISNATIKVYRLINDHWKYIDHDVTSSEEKDFFNEILKLKFVFLMINSLEW
jgi:hypothetical protein